MLKEVTAQIVLKRVRELEETTLSKKELKFIYRIRESIISENYNHALRLLVIFDKRPINKKLLKPKNSGTFY